MNCDRTRRGLAQGYRSWASYSARYSTWRPSRPPRHTTLASAQHSPSWMSNPAIAQREVLRQYYMANNTAEMVEVVLQCSPQILDVDTSLHMLCHTADVRLKGQLQGETGELLQVLYASMEGHVPQMRATQLGSLLWGLASAGPPSPELSDAVVARVAAQELAAGRVPRYNTKELTSIIHACGRLVQRYSRTAPQVVEEYVTTLVGELGRRLKDLPYVRSDLSCSDAADLAAACRAIYGGSSSSSSPSVSNSSSSSSGSSSSGRSGGSGGLPPLVCELLDELAYEVRRQLANKHSLRSPFTPRELVVFLHSYAALGYQSDKVAGMLDAVAGFVVRRIKARHLNSVSRPEDLAALLQAYSLLQHNSVVVPELLSAVGEQVCRNAAQQQEQRQSESTAGSSNRGSSPNGDSPGVVAGAGSSLPTPSGRPVLPDVPLLLMVDILESHLLLGYAPSELTMQALLPGLGRNLASGPPAPQVLRLLELLADLHYNPGRCVLGLMMARLEEGGEGGGEDVLRTARRLVARLEP